jgi:hypothetical protein
VCHADSEAVATLFSFGATELVRVCNECTGDMDRIPPSDTATDGFHTLIYTETQPLLNSDLETRTYESALRARLALVELREREAERALARLPGHMGGRMELPAIDAYNKARAEGRAVRKLIDGITATATAPPSAATETTGALVSLADLTSSQQIAPSTKVKWELGNRCASCETGFTICTRRHHCRR